MVLFYFIFLLLRFLNFKILFLHHDTSEWIVYMVNVTVKFSVTSYYPEGVSRNGRSAKCHVCSEGTKDC